MKSNKGALHGIRVLELGQLIAGPFCGQLLADHGAEVIKIELPKRGDPMRNWGQGLGVAWAIIARNKKCITLDIRSNQGKKVFLELVKQADVVLENFRPGTMEKWGFGYTELNQINPRVIMTRVTGYGQYGPYAPRAGYGSIGEAMGGLRYIVGDPSKPPSRVGISIGDTLAGMFACIGTLTSLQHREHTGRGQVVDSAIYEAVLAVMESTIAEYTEGDSIRERSGAILPGVAPSNVYSTADKQMILIAANQDSVFERLCQTMDREELTKDERYSTHLARGKNQLELDELIEVWSKQFAAEELLDKLEANGIPAGKIYRAPDMLADPHFQARETIIHVPHPQYKQLKMQNVFPRLSESPSQVNWPGPELGAHNNEVFQDILGYSKQQLLDLEQDGAM